MDASRLKDFSVHSVNWILSAISRSLQVIGQLQVDQTLSEADKTAQINIHQSLILNLAHFIVPFIDIAEEVFPQYKPLLDWVKSLYEDAINKDVLKACACPACAPSQDVSA